MKVKYSIKVNSNDQDNDDNDRILTVSNAEDNRFDPFIVIVEKIYHDTQEYDTTVRVFIDEIPDLIDALKLSYKLNKDHS